MAIGILIGWGMLGVILLMTGTTAHTEDAIVRLFQSDPILFLDRLRIRRKRELWKSLLWIPTVAVVLLVLVVFCFVVPISETYLWIKQLPS